MGLFNLFNDLYLGRAPLGDFPSWTVPFAGFSVLQCGPFLLRFFWGLAGIGGDGPFFGDSVCNFFMISILDSHVLQHGSVRKSISLGGHGFADKFSEKF